jgi:hypothetical protein
VGKAGFNELMGFMVAWNLWLFVILNTSWGPAASRHQSLLRDWSKRRVDGGKQVVHRALQSASEIEPKTETNAYAMAWP